MDLAQVFIFDLGWVFFAAWGTALGALGVLAFGSDVLALTSAGQNILRTNTQRKA